MSRTTELVPATADRPPLELVRSTRRRRSATAFVRDGVVVVQLPAGLPAEEERRTVERLVARVTGQARARARGGDDALFARAVALADRYLDGVHPTEVVWSSRMRQRWGSCTPSTGRIRISEELASVPDEVLDNVLVHELAHLHVSGHGPAFHALLDRHPHGEYARGFLAGMRHAQGQPAVPSSSEDSSPSSVDAPSGWPSCADASGSAD